MLRSRALGLALVSLLALASQACNQKFPDPADKQATAEAHQIFELCVQCHGAQAQGRKEFNAPSIAGLPRWYLEAQLRKFRSGARGTHFADLTGMQMRPMALSFHNEGDLTAIADFVSKLPRPKIAHQVTGGDAARGKTFYAPCTACHGPDGAGNEQLKAPPLRHASDWYLLTQLQKFRSGVRGTNPLDLEGATMRPMAATLVDDQAIKDVVAHITTLQ